MRVSLSGSTGSASSARRGCGPVVGTLFFLVFLVAGGIFFWMLLQETLGRYDTWFWRSAQCTIVDSELVTRSEGSGSPYVFEVRYTWDAEGGIREGTVYRPGYDGSSEVQDAGRLADRYPVGSTVDCLVDPDDPDRAVLRRGEAWFALLLLFPLVFVGVGLGGIVFVWRRPRGRRERSISSRARGKGGAWGWAFGLLFFGLFFVVGGALTWFLFVVPVTGMVQARGWEARDCRVISSEVRSHSSDDGTTYSVDILYAYTVGGREYRSSRYRFLGGSSSGYEGKRRVVDAHPEGATVTCWVDPDDPWSAVLDRSFSAAYLIGLLPALFLLVGGVGLGAMGANLVKRRRRSRELSFEAPDAGRFTPGGRGAGSGAGSGADPFAWADDESDGAAAGVMERLAGSADGVRVPVGETRGRQVLEPSVGRIGKVVGMLVLALFWNGIVSVFLWQLFTGDFEIFLALFLTPFVLVGLGLITGVFYTLLALANPRLHVELDRTRLALGSQVGLRWHFTGASSRLQGLRMTLVGRERATYRRGTDTRTDTAIFHRQVVFETDHPQEVERGSVTIDVPDDSMHSLDAPNNEITWVLEVNGDIPRWPDVGESFPLVVAAREPEGLAEDAFEAGRGDEGWDDDSWNDGAWNAEVGTSDAIALELDGDGPARLPGTRLGGRVRWSQVSDAEAPDALEVRLFWYTEGRGTQHVEIVAVEAFEDPGGLGRSGERRFAFDLPAGPYSVSGDLISLIWAVEAVFLPSEDSERMELVVAPGRTERRLAEVGDEDSDPDPTGP